MSGGEGDLDDSNDGSDDDDDGEVDADAPVNSVGGARAGKARYFVGDVSGEKKKRERRLGMAIVSSTDQETDFKDGGEDDEASGDAEGGDNAKSEKAAAAGRGLARLRAAAQKVKTIAAVKRAAQPRRRLSELDASDMAQLSETEDDGGGGDEDGEEGSGKRSFKEMLGKIKGLSRKAYTLIVAVEDDPLEFGVCECLFHLVAICCCIVLGYALLTKDMYTLSKSTPEGLSFSSTFDHVLMDFENVDTKENFEDWLRIMVLSHYDPTVTDMPFLDTPNTTAHFKCQNKLEATRQLFEGDGWQCPMAIKPINNNGVVLRYGITVSQQRGKVDQGKFVAERDNSYGQAWLAARRQQEQQQQQAAVGGGGTTTSTSSGAADSSGVTPARRLQLGPTNRSFEHTTILKPNYVTTSLFREDSSELDVAYPFGTGYHYRFDPTLTPAEAAVAIEELFASPFFDNSTRMVHVALWYEAPVWSCVDVAILFSTEISNNGFYFSHWTFRAIETSMPIRTYTCVSILFVVWISQIVFESWAMLRATCRLKLVGEYLLDFWNIVDWVNFGVFVIFATRWYYSHARGIDWEDSVLGDCEMMNIAYVQSKVWQRVKASYTWQFAFMMAITFWRTVKYLQVSPLVNAPKTAISSGSSEMLALFIVYALLSLGFGWIFYVNFYFLPEFQSNYVSLVTLFAVITEVEAGDDIFVGFGKSWKRSGQVMMIVFVLVNGIIFLNIFLSIVDTHYSKTLEGDTQLFDLKILRQLRGEVTSKLRAIRLLPPKDDLSGRRKEMRKLEVPAEFVALEKSVLQLAGAIDSVYTGLERQDGDLSSAVSEVVKLKKRLDQLDPSGGYAR
eukprot:g1280.t1